MKQDTKCALNLHKYEVYAEHEIKNYQGEVIQRAIVCRCSNCGRLRTDYVDLIVRR